VLPIVASTATTLIVFVPFVYFQGELAIFYVPLAIVVGLTLLASIFVAFTFIPALSARILKGSSEALRGVEGRTRRAPLYIRFYSGLLSGTLRFPWVTVAVAAICFGGSYHLFDQHVSRGTVFGGWSSPRSFIAINISLPRGSDMDRVDELTGWTAEDTEDVVCCLCRVPGTLVHDVAPFGVVRCPRGVHV
jgi:multidrug efflux pump subunit AcrB